MLLFAILMTRQLLHCKNVPRVPSPHGEGFLESAMIRKTAEGYVVISKKGKRLGGPYKSRSAAQKRLRQVEYFKHAKK